MDGIDAERNTQLLLDLTAAFAALLAAKPNDSKKGARVRSWVHDNFTGEDAGVAHIKEKKQIQNRVVEQFRHKRSTNVFLCDDETFLDQVERDVRANQYDGLKSALLFTGADAATFRLRRIVRNADPSPILTFLETAWPDAIQSTLPNFNSPHGAAVNERIVLDWDVAPATLTDVSDLLGLDTQYRSALAALRQKRGVILIGPPGTGKTKLARAICGSLGTPYDLVTANSEWSSFEVIGGYFPVPKLGEAVSTPIDFQLGVATESIRRGRWLIIDELNRADIDKAFGELFTLLSGDEVRLPYRKLDDGRLKTVVIQEGEQVGEDSYLIRVPEDWRIIGAMNTFDKASLYRLSFAFMRRFAFIYVDVPDPDIFSQILQAEQDDIDIPDEAAYLATWQECCGLVDVIFAGASDASLRSVGLAVGPAIPVDVLHYVNDALCLEPTAEASRLLLDALSMYVFPQFEGRDDAHMAIEALVSKALTLSDLQRSLLRDRLALWTGFTSPE